jgi:DNA recombination protein RmuC
MEFIFIYIPLGAIIIQLLIIYITLSKKRDNSEEISHLNSSVERLDEGASRLDALIRDEFSRSRTESAGISRTNREELMNSFKILGDKLDSQLREIREETAKRLEEMRKTVDENLKDTVEKRFNESFKLISERLEQVQKGLGEMQQLASGVGDLKRVLTTVKTKGNLGEIQLGAILEQVLSPAQYEAQANVKGAGDRERVDFVIKLPDKNSTDKTLLLPIDSKFPTEDYQRLLDAYDGGVDDEQKRAASAFEAAVKKCAKDIHDKYINPPVTTDFAIMFVPTEGLYAEIVRRADLFDVLQRQFKVTAVGPTNLAAFLSSLQMGFRTLAIEKHANDVWRVLGEVKTEFGKYNELIEKIKTKIEQASKDIDNFGTRSRAIERKLRDVGELPENKLT